MGSSDIKDILTSFSPSLDFFAISSGDGRIKIWDTVKGQLQTDFADIASTETSNLFDQTQKAHFSVDYTCMKWLSSDKKKKRKIGTSLLVLGTGSGDVLALDVSAGQLKWRVSDCHPGGVSAISFPVGGSCIYTAGADGMICELDSTSGNLLHKFKASSKAISSVSVSSDGKILATAAAQLKIFASSDQKKLQKFLGHPGPVRCMVFSDDGKYVLSSAVGERYIAVWEIDGSKKKSASCFLAMDHPAVFIDSKRVGAGDVDSTGLCVLAISEMGVCYFWHGNDIEDLRNSKPTKVCASSDDGVLKKQGGAFPCIFAAKLQTATKAACGNVFLAYGLLVKPSFDKILVHPGEDIKLKSSLDGIFLPISQSHKPKKASHSSNQVTVLDRANAEDALLRMPRIFDNVDEKTGAWLMINNDDAEEIGDDTVSLCMEDQLRSLGILSNDDSLLTSTFDSSPIGIIIKANIKASMPPKKMKAVIVSMEPREAYELLKVLLAMWQSRPQASYVLPWMSCILVNHKEYVASQESSTQLLDSIIKLTRSKGATLPSLLQLRGRLQLVAAQIEKGANKSSQTSVQVEQSNESEDEEVDEVLYGLEEDSETSSDSDN